MKAIKYQLRGLIYGVLITVCVIGYFQIQIRFTAGAEGYKLTQTEDTAMKLAEVMPKVIVPQVKPKEK